ncbi:VacB/RNase II family 3'-5' exoribonuclease [Alphaproteobacteria bacterium]|nr:VacB/RNase II family 3'-5' exoribonuclease [Alphaproteobacteria bacterium]
MSDQGIEDRPLPSDAELISFVNDQDHTPTVKEIARAFALKPHQRAILRKQLKSLAGKGKLDNSQMGKAVSGKSQLGKNIPEQDQSGQELPTVLPLKITRVTHDGDYLAKPADDTLKTDAMIRIKIDRRKPIALTTGDEVLARLSPRGTSRYDARVIRVLPRTKRHIYGAVIRTSKGYMLENADRNARHNIDLLIPAEMDIAAGDFVEAELKQGRGYLNRTAQVVRRIGDSDNPNFSALAIAEHDLPNHFPEDVLAEAKLAKIPDTNGRTDIRDMKLITIDGADARDFDDAVFAEPHPDGWRVVVAIADVAHYVPEGSALDREAQLRGNSVYLPEMVVPMLPEDLSNGLCSLRPDEDRACVVADMTIDNQGHKTGHRIYRALMRSHARLTYDDVEQVITHADADADADTPQSEQNIDLSLISNLHAAYQCLSNARKERGALELDLAEKRIVFDAAGKATGITKRYQNTSQKIIEEMMILANVAAAETLESSDKLCVYRAHEPPDPARLDSLHDLCRSMGLSFAKGQVIRPADFNQLLHRAKTTCGDGDNQLLNETVLRCQSQANYRITNPGHYGLGLIRYAHFTSPIRRYSDLMVHRSLMGESKIDAETAAEICQQISDTERRAANAERRSIDRYAASLVADETGHIMAGKVISITGFGAFIELIDHSTEGLLPLAQMPPDYYHVDTTRGIMRGDRNGIEVKTGDQIDVMIMSVTPIKGSVLLSWANGGIDGENSTTAKPKGQLSRRRMKKPPHKKNRGAKKLSKQRQKS